jgi:hypothetical protein
MSTPPHLTFTRPPSVAAYMWRAFHRAPGLAQAGSAPAVGARWLGHRPDPAALARLRRLTGLGEARTLPILYPHVVGFRLVLAVLTHPAVPVSIWNSLGVRTHLLLRQPVPVDTALDFETRVAGLRILEKGAELDLHTTAGAQGEVLWESLNTFYYRGRHGAAGAPSPLAAAPEAGGTEVARWTAGGTGWAMGRLTGDFNPVHWSGRYARRSGFQGSFHHPPTVVGQCLARLAPPDPAGPARLDWWAKGPVYHGAQVSLLAREEDGGAAFALFAEGDPRPAILGRWSGASAGSTLLEAGPPAT